jgi:hypothetical protein
MRTAGSFLRGFVFSSDSRLRVAFLVRLALLQKLRQLGDPRRLRLRRQQEKRHEKSHRPH